MEDQTEFRADTAAARRHFDPAFYLRAYPDVGAEKTQAIEHYFAFGASEGRSPVCWFDPHLQAAATGTPLAECFAWFLAAAGPDSIPSAAVIAATAALVDADFYLASNPDVAAASIDPQQHFLDFGWREGRNPQPDFSLSAWRAAEMEPVLAGLNPLIHYLVREQARQTAPDEIGLLAALLAARRAAVPLSAAPVAAIIASDLFDADAYARASGIAGDRTRLAAHYLAEGAARGLDPGPLFSAAFYRAVHQGLPGACPPDMPPLLHYLQLGRAQGFATDPLTALHDVALLRLCPWFDPEDYADRRGADLRWNEPALDYVLRGHLEGVPACREIDEPFVRRLYTPLTGEDIRAPAVFLMHHRDKIWLHRSPQALHHHAGLVRDCPLFDAGFYAEKADLPPGLDPALHYAVAGLRQGLAPGPDFDTAFYTARNPDIAHAKVDPMLHFHSYGRKEGRAPLPRRAEEPAPGRRPDPRRPQVILFTHEMSRTGAPIVAVTIARRLMRDFDVIVWSGETDGPLRESFARMAVQMRMGWDSPEQMEREIREIAEGRETVALVNSAVCNPAIAPLHAAGLPIVSLIHEFAQYVSPEGTTTRMATYSDRAVFPATIVLQACLDEMEALGIGRADTGLRVRHQGHNVVEGRGSPLTPAILRDRMGLPAAKDPAAARQDRILLGAGQVQPRKGVDLFLQTARHLLDESAFDWRFIWVGGGYEPKRDFVTSVYLKHQLRAAGLEGRVVMMPAQRDLTPFWQVADVFFLSSRLDPFPNVALDAWEAKLPVVCFDQATGIADVEAARPFALEVVRHADAHAAARAIDAFAARTAATAAAFAGPQGMALARELTFDAYVDEIEGLLHEATTDRLALVGLQADSRRADVATLSASDRLRRLRRIPPLLRLSGGMVDRPMLDDASMLRLGRPEAPAAAPRCAAALGGPVWQAPGPGHLVHLHLLSPATLPLVFGPESWLQLATTDLVMTAETSEVAEAIEAALGEAAATRLVGIHADPLEALEAVLATPDGQGASLLSFVPVWEINTLPQRPGLPGEVCDALLLLYGGAAAACLAADENLAAVAPPRRQDDRTRRVERLLAQSAAAGPGDPDAAAPPHFCATFRAARLRRFLADVQPRSHPDWVLLGNAERLGLVAGLFARHAPGATAIGPAIAD